MKYQKPNIKNQISKGFTLIELLVVIGIISILVSIGSISYLDAQGRGRDSKRQQELKSLEKALELYHQDNSAYPSTSGAWYSNCTAWGASQGVNGWIPGLVPTYIRQLPLDPKRGANTAAMSHPGVGNTTATYCYIYYSNGVDYKAAAHCAIEGNPIDSTNVFYKGNLNWNCDNYPSAGKSNSYAVYTDGAGGW